MIVHGKYLVQGQVHQEHEQKAGHSTDDDALLLFPKISLQCLILPVGGALITRQSQELVAGIDNRLFHLCQAHQAGIVYHIGLLRGQVYPRLHHSIQFQQSLLQSRYAHGAGHAPDLEHDLIIYNIIACIFYGLLQIGKVEAFRIILDQGRLCCQVDRS